MFKMIPKYPFILIGVILFFFGCASAPPKADVKKIARPDICSSYSATDTEFGARLDEISSALISGRKWQVERRIAVINFGDMNGNVTDFGKYLAEELITKLGAMRVNLVERSLLEKALAELKLNTTDLFNQKSAVRLGELVGADAILTGTITDMGETVRVNSRLIETETGRIASTSGVDIKKTASVCNMLKSGAVGTGGNFTGAVTKPLQKRETGKNLVVNGDFRNRYEGWEKVVGDEGKGSSKTEIAKYSNSKSGTALHIRHTGEGFIQFEQTVDVTDVDVMFSATFEARSHEGPMKGFSGTGATQIVLTYMDENEKILGQTYLVNYIKNMFADSAFVGVPRLNSDTNTGHYIELKNNVPYRNYKIGIRQELEDNLIGVNTADVRKIAISIWCSATDRRAGTELWISDISLAYK